jgi:hypothetical protein|nr:MAG TPA: hypothetical protein [Caudoviricetes sp.]
MDFNAAPTTTAQVEEILTNHSIAYTTTDIPDEEDSVYLITVGDVTASVFMAGCDVWATTDENPAAAYDGPANADEIALHLMHYASKIPGCVAVIDAIENEAAGDISISYWDECWEVEDSHTTIEVDINGTWKVTHSSVPGIEWSGYEGRDVAAVFRAGALAYGQPLDAIATVIIGGDYEMTDWWSIVDGLTDLQATDGDAGTRVYNHWGSGHPGVLVTEEDDDMESRWVITDLDAVMTSVEHSAQDAAANVIYTLA